MWSRKTQLCSSHRSSLRNVVHRNRFQDLGRVVIRGAEILYVENYPFRFYSGLCDRSGSPEAATPGMEPRIESGQSLEGSLKPLLRKFPQSKGFRR